MDNLLSFGEAFFAGTVPEAIETASREERVMLAYFFDDEAMEPVFREPAVAERLGTDTVSRACPGLVSLAVLWPSLFPPFPFSLFSSEPAPDRWRCVCPAEATTLRVSPNSTAIRPSCRRCTFCRRREPC